MTREMTTQEEKQNRNPPGSGCRDYFAIDRSALLAVQAPSELLAVAS